MSLSSRFTEAKVDVPGGRVSFAAGFSDHPAAAVAKPDTFLNERMTTPRRGTTEVLHQRSITLGTSPGRVLIMKRNISGTPLRVYSRLDLGRAPARLPDRLDVRRRRRRRGRGQAVHGLVHVDHQKH